jgi:hypothetical protein
VLSDLINDTTYSVSALGGGFSVNVAIPAYGAGAYVLADSAKRLTLPVLTGVGTEGSGQNIPGASSLDQNYPNPFNPETRIGYSLAQKGHTRLSVFDLLGREVAVLVDTEQVVGYHEVTFGSGHALHHLPSGVYFYQLVIRTEHGDVQRETKKMVLMQ